MSFRVLPPIAFEVTKDKTLFPVKKKMTPMQKAVWNLFSVVVFPVGICRISGILLNRLAQVKIVPASRMDKVKLATIREQLINRTNDSNNATLSHKFQRLKTVDGVVLDSLSIIHADQKKLPASQQRWIIVFNPNKGAFEKLEPAFAAIARTIRVNILLGNYRGVGSSQGKPKSAKRLLRDAETMIRFLLSRGVKPENILLHGWSLGGGISAVCAWHFQNKAKITLNVCNDRSFATLTKAILVLARIPVINHVAAILTKMVWGKLNVAKKFKNLKGYTFIIHHKQDHVITYTTSLYKKLKNSRMTKADRQAKWHRVRKKKDGQSIKAYEAAYKPARVIRLRHDTNGKLNAHGSPINNFPSLPESEGFADYIAHVKQALRM